MRQNKSEYLLERMFSRLKLTDEKNTISLKAHQNRTQDVKICNSDSEGNIVITPYKLSRECWFYTTKSKFFTGYYNDNEIWRYKRLSPENEYKAKNGDLVRMAMPKGQIVPPFISKSIIDDYEQGKEISTLYLTEGYIKAIKLHIDGLHSVGLGSITLYKEKETNSMYEDIRTVINNCNVKNVVVIYDADCYHVSVKDVIDSRDIKRRPNNFLCSFKNISELLKGYGLDVFFVALKKQDERLKGIDDLLENCPDAIDELRDLGLRSGKYFEKITELKKIEEYLGLLSVENIHKKNSQVLRNKTFKYEGMLYADKEGELINSQKNPDEINFFAVGNGYFIFGSDGELHERSRQMLKDMGNSNTEFVNCRKFDSFTNEPFLYDDYKKIVDNKFNLYHKYKPEVMTDNCDTILHLVEHIFQEQYEMGLDYLWQLYFNRKQKLPILCLLSKEQGTGKNTFAQTLMMELFGSNYTQIGNIEISQTWNDNYISKNVVHLNEILIDKKIIYEKIKTFSTEPVQPLQKRFTHSKDIPCHMRLMISSNNEYSFIKLTEDDRRFWVRKIGVPKETNIGYVENIKKESGYFVEFLEERGCKYETKGDRMFFEFSDYKTLALERIIDDSRSELYVEIFEMIKSIFLKYPSVEYLHYNLTEVHELVWNNNPRINKKWVRLELRDSFKSKLYSQKRYLYYPRYDNVAPYDKNGSCYEFERSYFVKEEEEEVRAIEKPAIYQSNDNPF